MRRLASLGLYTAFALLALLPASSARAQDGVGVITVANESDLTVYFLYASSCQEEEWGDDLLGSDTIAPGNHLEVPLDAGCWDLKAVAEDGQEVETYRVDLEANDVVVWTVDEED